MLIALIVWWFWIFKPKAQVIAQNEITVEVKDGVYSPALIQIVENKPFQLHFIRKDQSPCSETLMIPDLNISESLPFNEIKSIDIPALKAGNYAFHCQMQMYRGEISVSS